MALRHIPIAAGLLFALAGGTTPVGAQVADSAARMARPDGIPQRTQDAVKAALLKIGASTDANTALLNLVRAHDGAKVRAMLIQYGVKPGELRNVIIDALGSTQGARILDPLTIYFDVIPQGGTIPEPVGLVYLGHPYGWVDWNTFANSWAWW